MKAKILNLLYLVMIASCTLLISSCSKQDNVTSPAPVSSQISKLPDAVIAQNAGKAVNEILNNSIISFMGYQNINTGNGTGSVLTKSSPSNKTKESTDDGYYIFYRTFIDPQYPSAYTGSLYCKIQFYGDDGSVCRNPHDASSVYTYISITGAFGFVDNEPYGDKSVQTLSGMWTNIKSVPTFNGSGTYERTWSGLYSSTENESDEQSLTIHYAANVNVQQLKLNYVNGQLNISGQVDVNIENYHAVGLCSGSGALAISVYKAGELINSRQIDISNKLSNLSFYLNLLN